MKRPPLKDNKDLYQNIFELSPDSIVTLNTMGIVTSVNPAGAKIAGYPQKELIGRHFAKLGQLHFRDIPKYIRLFNSAVRGKEIKPFEIDLVRKDKKCIIAEIRVGLLRDNGKITGIQAITRNITERKKAEKEIKNLASFPQLNPNPVLELNRNGKVLYCNPAALKQFPDIIKKGSDHPIFKDIYMVHGKIKNEVKVGDKWYFRSSYNNNNKRIYCIDITDRMKAEERIAKFNECFVNFGSDPDENIQHLVETIGELLGATCALYNRLQGGLLCSLGQWNAPGDYKAEDKPEGHICYDVIRKGSDVPKIIRGLLKSKYAKTDPNVSKYKLNTYVGIAVKCRKIAVGALCVVYQSARVMTDDELRLMNIAASAIGVEEERKKAEEEIIRRSRQLSILNEIANSIGQSLDINKILNDGLEKVLDLMGLKVGGIYLADHEHRKLDLIAHRGISKRYAREIGSISVDDKTLKAATEKGRILKFALQVKEVFKNLKELKRVFSAMKREGLDPAYQVPILLQAKGEILGLMVMASRKPRKYSERELDLLSLVGQQISVAVKNAKLYDAAQKELAERKRVEEALLQSNEIFGSFMENSPIYVFFKDVNIRAIRLSRNYETMLGRPIAELLGKNMEDLFPSELAKSMVADDMRILKEGKKVNVEEELNGRVYSTIKFPVQIEGKPRYLAGYTIDITKHKKAEEELRQREKKLKTIFDVLPVGISILDANRKIIYGNHALERILGISMEGLLRGDHKSRKYLRPDGTPMPAEEFASVRAGKEQRAIYNVETGVVREDGSIIWTDVSAVPVKFPDWKVVLVTIDITDRKRAEEELQKSERHKMMGTFISGIAHEVRNPLVSVKGFFQLLNDRETSEKDKQEIAGLAVNEIKRMESLLDSLLSFARPSKGESIDSDIHKLISDSIVLLKHDASKQGIKMNTHLDAGHSHTLVDPKQLQQVFLNLSMNALDAMKKGGTLRISTSYLKDQNIIRVTFRDTGHGIKKELMPRLFEPFFTTKENGTGLGLPISQRIIENYKGKMTVESKEGKGTSVHVTLPAS